MFLNHDSFQGDSFRQGIPQDKLRDSIESLLIRIPEAWGEYAPDKLSVIEVQALFLLATAGYVEARRHVRLRWSANATFFEAKYSVTGSWFDEVRFAPGLAVWAIPPIRAMLLNTWRESIRSWLLEARRMPMPFVCEPLYPQEWRLLHPGIEAKHAFAKMHPDLIAAALIDVLDYPAYVNGHVRVELCEPKLATPTDVRVTNAPEMAEQNAEALVRMLAPLIQKLSAEDSRPAHPSTDEKATSESKTPSGNPVNPEAAHNADFTMVRWFGQEYHFALGIQSSAVKALWMEWEKSGLGLHQDTIREQVDEERDKFRMDLAFRDHPAFGTMIQRRGDGRYTLCPPGSQTKTSGKGTKKRKKT